MKKNELRKWRENYTPWDKPIVTEGLRLAVHFDEKDHVKRMGARWQPDPSGNGGYWWMPISKLQSPMLSDVYEIVNVFEVDDIVADRVNGADGLTCLEWLNRNKMVYGPDGDIIEENALAAMEDLTPIVYEIRHETPDSVQYSHGKYYVFDEIGVVNWTPDGRNPNYNRELLTLEQARASWELLISAGYRPVSDVSS